MTDYLTMGYEFNFYLVASLAVLLTGISKSGFSTGGGMMAVPLMSIFLPPQVAAAIMLPLLCFIDVTNIWRYWKLYSLKYLKILVPGALAGILIGTLTWKYISVSGLRLGIGVLALFFVGRYILQMASRAPERKLGRLVGSVLGAISGLTSFVAHAGGPPANAYLLSQKPDKTLLVATNVYLFGIINAVKLVPYFALGQFSAQNLGTSLILAPLVPVGVVIGYFLHGKISQPMFMKVSYVFLTLAGIKLIYDGITGML